MSKYDPLGVYLGTQHKSRITMTFREIEQILTFPLPRSKQHRAWWSNNPSNNVMTYQWLKAGYETEAVDIAGERLTFRRAGGGAFPVSAPEPSGGSDDVAAERDDALPKRDPIFGCMSGTLKLLDGVDLTEPFESDWSESLSL
ncbi:DUF7662 domain-containing protein [Jiella mangrovi]|uniref:DUF7662 domain-containing protein n=1 Tax=Jiella mangrovi TaxID=2821407 RepID=A0ABS4BEG6_9HYPH|nr:hypothetical protein [Jiella mangrovi]MBP0615143.1 hypothetical protein [Jiella mangrovi]